MTKTVAASELKTSRGFKGGLRQSMSWLHTWVGLLLAVVLYFMFITGTVGYFNSEVDYWMRPEAKAVDKSVPQREMIARAIARLQETTPSAKEWYISLPHNRQSPKLEIYSQPQPDATGKEVDGKNEILDEKTGQPVAGVRNTGGGGALYALHYALHYIPYYVAMYIVGVATMFMLIAILSGIAVHKKIFKDFFTFRIAKGQRSWLDAHNVTSVMALPFFVMITYSGLIFYTYEYMPSVRLAVYGRGEANKKVFDKEIHGEVYASLDPARVEKQLAPLAPMLDMVEKTWGANSIRSIAITDPGDANARVRVERTVTPSLTRHDEKLLFDGVTGERLSLKEEPKFAAAKFSDVLIALHEGHFATPLFRWIYFVTGLLGAAMIATGTVLWTTKRRQQLGKNGLPDIGLRFVERMNVGMIVGLPIAIATYFWANRLLPVTFDAREEWEMHVLFMAWALAFAHASLRPLACAWREQLIAAAMLFALLPLVNAVTTDVHLVNTFLNGDWIRASFDLTMLALAGVSIFILFRIERKAKRAQYASEGNAAKVAANNTRDGVAV